MCASVPDAYGTKEIIAEGDFRQISDEPVEYLDRSPELIDFFRDVLSDYVVFLHVFVFLTVCMDSVRGFAVPSSWTRKPEDIQMGEYIYDNEASAFFYMGEFPFNDFVQYISGKSSYDMSEAICKFYKQLEMKDTGEDVANGMVKKIRVAYAKEIAPKLRKLVKRKYLAPILGVSETTISNWCPDTKDEEESSGDEKTASETGD